MEKHVPYDVALNMKVLGYKTDYEEGEWYFVTLSNGNLKSFCWTSDEDEPYETYKPVIAPLWQEAFDWFLEKYKIYVEPLRDGGTWLMTIRDISNEKESSPQHKKYVLGTVVSDSIFYDVRLLTLRTLIQIVKNEK